ncbi:MAG: ABC transporter ATP-binding protein [Lachnospiraceae bacterium]|nr:ABC transporter ATP-binding protein [Lachnospiraceae bacterium]
MEKDLLTIENLSVFFGKKAHPQKAVDHISFTIRKGEVIGLAGESGCGKTTTGRAIAGLTEPSGGSIWFHDQRIAVGTLDQRAALKQLRRELRAQKKNGTAEQELLEKKETAACLKQEIEALEAEEKRCIRNRQTSIQMVFQDPAASLDPRMTAEEIVSEGLRIRGELRKDQIRETAGKILETVGLSREQASRFPHEFSGGQRQRIGIARALIMEPELLIADEPVSALDVSVRAQIIHLLNDLRKDRSLSVLFIAHDLSLMQYCADRVAVMYGGQIVELAEKEELFSRPLHPYTKALLSAIPIPDPIGQKMRKRVGYEPGNLSEQRENQVFEEIVPGHFVLGTWFDLEQYRSSCCRDGLRK